MNTRNLTIGVAALIAAGLALPASALSISSLFGNSDEPVMCTMEAKMCPDGSYVGRTGPQCEFAACPGETDTSNWQTYRNDEKGFEVQYAKSAFMDLYPIADVPINRVFGVNESTKDGLYYFSVYAHPLRTS